MSEAEEETRRKAEERNRRGAAPPWRDRRGVRLVSVCVALAAIAVVAVVFGLRTARSHDILVVDPNWMNPQHAQRGTINLCAGKDLTKKSQKQPGSGTIAASVNAFNAKYGRDGVKVNLMPFGETADQQYSNFTADQQSAHPKCDVFYSDIVWTATFAARRWLYDLTPYVARRGREFVPKVLKTARYAQRYWGVPKAVDVGLLYYRSDRVRQPQTWHELYRLAEPYDGLTYQGEQGEGLTCNFLEIADAVGADPVVTADHRANIDQPATRTTLRFMLGGVNKGAVSRAVLSDVEDLSLREFESGGPNFMRNWPYAYARLKRLWGKNFARRIRVVALPPWRRGGKATSMLGGHNLVISRYTKSPGDALLLVDFLTSPQQIKNDVIHASLPPVLSALWDDAEVRKNLPTSELRRIIDNASTRPIEPGYTEISDAIYANVYSTLTASNPNPDADLQQAQIDMARVLAHQPHL